MVDDISVLRMAMQHRLQETDSTFHRYLYQQINWSNRLIGIKGYRGVGKTTMIIQHIKENFPDLNTVLYASLDNGWFQTHSLYDLAQYHYMRGGTHLFLDEVHRYAKWQDVLKNIYDDFPSLHVVFTGSSMLNISTEANDLSRRMRLYTLPVLSLREYVELETGIAIPSYTLEKILKDHLNISARIINQLPIQKYFESYLQNGCYPFYLEDIEGFGFRLQETLWKVLESDWPSVEEVSFATIQKTKRLLMVLSESVPLTPNMSELFAAVETNREGGLRMLYLLERAGVLSLCSRKNKSFASLRKPDKIYLGNSNLMCALSAQPNIGTIRETFFYNQLVSASYEVLLPPKGDFKVNDRYLFEIGGANKGYRQIRNEPESFLAVDNLEMGDGNRIPLWLFGFLY